MINRFIETCRNKGGKTAFVYGRKRVTFSTLLSDVYKMADLFNNKGLTKDSRVLLLVQPSYEFYVLLFACIYYGVNVVVMDSYKDLGRIKRTLKENRIDLVFCNSLTRAVSFKLGADIEYINISGYSKYSDSFRTTDHSKEKTVLTTFTSGTTGAPKPIERNVQDLEKQIKAVSENIKINEEDVVYAGLPIYVLFLVYSGLTCVISRRMDKRELKRIGVTAALAPISKLLDLRGSMPFIQKLYFGGAVLYRKDAERLRSAFPSAETTYIYGSSECVLMAMSDLDHYISHDFAMKDRVIGVELEIIDQDKNGVGRIRVKGDVVLSDDNLFVGNDIGYFDPYGLHIVGRSRYSAEGCYNYVMDNRLLEENPKVRKGFFFVHEGNHYFCYEGKLSVKYSDIACMKFLRLPMDPKHKTKLDYVKVIEKIKK